MDNTLPQTSPESYISFNGTVVITSPESDSFNDAVSFLKSQSILGFDTETRPSFKKGISNKVTLVQFATKENAFLFRLINHFVPYELIQLFENNQIIKVGVGISQDVKNLQKIKRFNPQSFIEIQTLAKKNNIEALSLRKLCEYLFQKKLSKRQQLSNWESAALSEAQIKYAATDAWVSYLIYMKLTDDEFNPSL
jgi:ribonuclease D